VRLSYEWHMARRRREQGRLTTNEWLEWAGEYIGALEDTPWKRWCQAQVRDFKAFYLFTVD
jgi:hypothetical protein